MRRGWMLGGLLGVLALASWWAVGRTPEPASRPGGAGEAGTPGALGRLLQTWASPGTSPGAETAPRIRGVVRDARGPVAGARVLASATEPGESLSELACSERTAMPLLDCHNPGVLFERVARRSGEALVLARATSDTDGSFSLEGLTPGRYALWVEAAEGTALRRDVEAGAEGVALVLGPSLRVTGLIQAEDEKPVEGALVTAIFKRHSRFFEALTDARGHFALETLPQGEYTLVIAREGLLSEERSLLGYLPEMKVGAWLSFPRRLEGTVVHAGAPVAGVPVRTYSVMDATERVARTDARGHFALEGLPPMGNYELLVEHEGLRGTLAVEIPESEAAGARPVTERTGLILELTPATSLSGVVRDEAGRPVENAEVTVSREELWEGEPFFQSLPSTRTDAQGRYTVESVEPGVFQFEVDAEGFLAAEPQTWEVEAGPVEVDLDLKRAVVLEGRLVDAEGQPVEKGSLHLTSEEPQDLFSATVGEGGRFSFDLPRPGRFRLQVTGGDLEESPRVEVTAPATDVRVRVTRQPRVVGTVVDATGLPLPNVEVALWPEVSGEEKPRPLHYSGTDAEGRFSLAAPTEGDYRVVAEFFLAGSLRSASRQVRVGREGAEVALRLEDGQPLSGVVVDSRGRPLEGVSVQVHDTRHTNIQACGAPARGVKTGPDGRFHFPSVSGSSLVVAASKDGYVLSCAGGALDTRRLPVAPGTREQRVVLVKQALVRGKLLQPDGKPVTVYSVNGVRRASPVGVFFAPIQCTGPLTLELSAAERVPGSAPLRHTVSVQEEVDQDIGTLVLGGP